jgi:hypothetical protein
MVLFDVSEMPAFMARWRHPLQSVPPVPALELGAIEGRLEDVTAELP